MRRVSGNPEDPHRYDDMLDLPHHVSGTRPHMTMEQRAAQFTPFAALTGYEEAIKESSRLTERKIDLSEQEQEDLNWKLQILKEHEKEKPEVAVTWFEEDPEKEGGTYVQKTVTIRQIDIVTGNLVLTSRKMISIPEIIALESPLFDQNSQ